MSDPSDPPGCSASTSGTSHCPASTPETMAESPFTASIEGNGIELHPTAGERGKVHGTDYAVKLLMLWLYRLYTVDQDYWVSIEDSRAGKFDDFHLQLKQDDGSWMQYFVQIKHTDNRNTLLGLDKDLFSKSSAFSLGMYFQSFVKVQNCSDKKFHKEGPRKYVLFTNRNLNFGDSKGDFHLTRDIFTTEFDNDIFKTLIFKFKSTFPGRDILVKILCNSLTQDEKFLTEVEKKELVEIFLNNFYLAVGQNHVTELDQIIEDELKPQFGIETKNAYSTIHSGIRDWFSLKGNQGTRINSDRVLRFFKNIRRPTKNINFHCMDPVSSFHGRKKFLGQMAKTLFATKSDTPPKINVVIWGMEGVGKSELARLYAMKYREEYDYTIWINSETEETLQDSFTKLYTFLELPENEPLSLHKKICNIYARLKKKRCLLIFDNAIMVKKTYDVLHNFMPEMKSTKHDIIMTSQFGDWADCCLKVHLDIFTEEESVNFLTFNLPASCYSESSELVELAKTLDYLPLALQNALQLLIEKSKEHEIFGKSESSNISFVCDFIVTLQKKSVEAENFLESHYNPGTYPPYIKKIIQLVLLGVDRISNSKFDQKNEALKLFFSLAYLQPDNISVDMLFHHPLIRTREQLNGIVLFLNKRSLIKAQSGYISIHRLLQDALVIILGSFNIENLKCFELIKTVLKNRMSLKYADTYKEGLQYSSISHEPYEFFCVDETQSQEMFFPFLQNTDNPNFESLLPKNAIKGLSKSDEIDEKDVIIPGKLALEYTRVMVEISAVHCPRFSFYENYMRVLQHAERMNLVEKNFLTHAVYFRMSLIYFKLDKREMREHFSNFVEINSRKIFGQDSLRHLILLLMLLIVCDKRQTANGNFEGGIFTCIEAKTFQDFLTICEKFACGMQPYNYMLFFLINHRQFHMNKKNSRKKQISDLLKAFLRSALTDQIQFVHKLACLPLVLQYYFAALLRKCVNKSPKSTTKLFHNLQPEFMKLCQKDFSPSCICFETVCVLYKWYLTRSVYCKMEQLLLTSISHESVKTGYNALEGSVDALCIAYDEMFPRAISLAKSTKLVEENAVFTLTKFDKFQMFFTLAEKLERNGEFSAAKTKYIDAIRAVLDFHRGKNHETNCQCDILNKVLSQIFHADRKYYSQDMCSALYRAIKMCYMETNSYEECCKLLNEIVQEYEQQLGKDCERTHILLIRALILEEAELFEQANSAWTQCLQYFLDSKIPYYGLYKNVTFVWSKISDRKESLPDSLKQNLETVIMRFQVDDLNQPEVNFTPHSILFTETICLGITILASIKKFETALSFLENTESLNCKTIYPYSYELISNYKLQMAQWKAENTYKMRDIDAAESELKQILEEKLSFRSFAKPGMDPSKLHKKTVVKENVIFYNIAKSKIYMYINDDKLEEAILEIDTLFETFKNYLKIETNYNYQSLLDPFIWKKISLQCKIQKFEDALEFWKEYKKFLNRKYKDMGNKYDFKPCKSLIHIFKKSVKAKKWQIAKQCMEIWEQEKFNDREFLEIKYLQQCVNYYRETGNLTESQKTFEHFCQSLTQYYLDRLRSTYDTTNFNCNEAITNLKIGIFHKIISKRWQRGRFSLIYYAENRITELEILFCIAFCFYNLNDGNEALVCIKKLENILVHKKKDTTDNLQAISENVSTLRSLCEALPGKASSGEIPSQDLVLVEEASSCGYTGCRCHMIRRELEGWESELVESDGDSEDEDEPILRLDLIDHFNAIVFGKEFEYKEDVTSSEAHTFNLLITLEDFEFE